MDTFFKVELDSKKINNMKKIIYTFILAGMMLSAQRMDAFCGFYVAKADATLFNNKSEVILVRNGDYTVVTMGSDFKGDVRDFAMVVPVPVVLGRGDISIVDRGIFDRLEAYSSPRLAEYYDADPCMRDRGWIEDMERSNYPSQMMDKDESVSVTANKKYNVTVEAQYTVGEYDILLLSANESVGLKNWLTDNGYKIPAKAERVLAPYIKSNMKFFVVKVNLAEMKKSGYDALRPIQIRFNHPKFMLPLRLGMANSQGTQDMLVYAFSANGRVECSNYRNVKMPTDRSIPVYVKNDFGAFYKDVFETAYEREGKNAVFLEYAWNVTPTWGGMKCDPCVGPPPLNQDFYMAGVNWFSPNQPNTVFFTRMHVRYDEAHFPADLNFMVTSNQENFQARYVLQNPAIGFEGWACEEGQQYLVQLHDRRKMEMDELYAMTGGRFAYRDSYIREYDSFVKNPPGEWSNDSDDLKEEYGMPNKKGGILPESVLPDWEGQTQSWNGLDGILFLGIVTIFVLVFRTKSNP
jgi:hypothetical protein